MADDVQQLLSEYIAEHRAGGEADPLAYLARADPARRNELAALIDAYLERSPGREWDPVAYRGSDAERVAEEFARSLAGVAGFWPTVLPRLRKQAKLPRRQVVERLAEALGVAGREEKVGAYYHEMEQGQLDSAGVSERVLDALGRIYDTTAASLREIGEPLGRGPGPAGQASPAMARTARPDARYASAEDRIELADKAMASPPERDEIDDLFTGGG